MVKHSDIRYPFEIGLVSRTQKEHAHISKKKGRQLNTKVAKRHEQILHKRRPVIQMANKHMK